ncbi:MAG: hypothetical protein ABIR04_10885 [Cypionkella sp.]
MTSTTKNQGEGNYEAAKKFDDAQHAFAASGKVADKARAAADAVDGPEAEDLKAASEAAAKGKSA